MNKNEIILKMTELNNKQKEIEKELESLRSAYSNIAKIESQKYIGNCYKQEIDDGVELLSSYYKIVDIYEDNLNYFWAIKVNKYYDENTDCRSDIHYISKDCINLLGFQRFMLRGLTQITIEEFYNALDEVYKNLKGE